MEKRIYDADVERLSRDEIKLLRQERLTELLSKVWRENAFYRERWTAAGVSLDKITDQERFTAEIPTVEKEDFVEDQKAFPPFGMRHKHVLEARLPLVVSNTSGTSGQGVEIHAQTAEEF